MTQALIDDFNLSPVFPDFEWSMRPASVEDISSLVDLRVKLFQSIQTHPRIELDQLAKNTFEYLSLAIPTGAYRAWLAETNQGVVATGGVIIHQSIPTLCNPCGREGHIVGMFTLPEWRNRGIASAMINTILQFLHQEKIRVSTLRATHSGKPMYERMGFENTTEMRLFLPPAVFIE